MPFVCLALLTIAAVIFAANPRRGLNRWLSGTALSGALGALAVSIDYYIYPYLDAREVEEGLMSALYRLQAFSSLASYYGLPFAFLMFGIRYREVALPERWSRLLPAVLAVPPLVTLGLTPGYTETQAVAFAVVASWAVPYIVIGTVLVLGKREVNRVLRRSHQLVCLTVLPPVALFMVLNYVLQSLGMIGAWRYNTWMVFAAFAIFLYSLFRYGFLGVQLLVQTRRLDSTLRAVTSGTAILNHAIKNDVGKMRLFGEKIRVYAEQTGQAELAADIGVILRSSDHVQEMIARVHERTQELPLQPAVHSVSALLDEALAGVGFDGVELVRTETEGLQVVCDRAQVVEVFGNIARNAAEAMPDGGRLEVRASETKRAVVVEFRDSGLGIDRKELRKVLEPFYTTKAGRTMNFGLGLAYSYSVMKQHGGTLDLHSVVGEGTTVSLSFPKRKEGRRR